MRLGHLIRAAVIVAAAFLLVASASASTISYTTSVTGSYTTGFTTGSPLVLSNTSGVAATLTFTGTTAAVNTPTNVSLGDFLVVCSSCSTTVTSTFGAFTFDLYLYDSTDGAYALFTGTSTGGTVSSNSSGIQIAWTPAQIGPGLTNVSGSTGAIYFNISTPTLIVAPNSGSGGGSSNGDTTVQVSISGSNSVPEPATMALAGGLLIGLAALARKRRS